MGRNCHGPKLTWADFVMGRNDPEPYEPLKLRQFRGQKPGRGRDYKMQVRSVVEMLDGSLVVSALASGVRGPGFGPWFIEHIQSLVYKSLKLTLLLKYNDI